MNNNNAPKMPGNLVEVTQIIHNGTSLDWSMSLFFAGSSQTIPLPAEIVKPILKAFPFGFTREIDKESDCIFYIPNAQRSHE
jgi:hypothetical protein